MLPLLAFLPLCVILEEIEKNTTLVLVNAVHFKDSWKEEFRLQSKEMKFQRTDGKTVSTYIIINLNSECSTLLFFFQRLMLRC